MEHLILKGKYRDLDIYFGLAMLVPTFSKLKTLCLERIKFEYLMEILLNIKHPENIKKLSIDYPTQESPLYKNYMNGK